MTQPTIKEKMEKLLTDEILNPEPCNIRLFATNITRLICEEMTGEKCMNPHIGGKYVHGFNARIDAERKKAQEILKTLE